MNSLTKRIPLILILMMCATLQAFATDDCNKCQDPEDPTLVLAGFPPCAPKVAGTTISNEPCKECDGYGNMTNKLDGDMIESGIEGRCCGGVWYPKDPLKEASACWEWTNATCEYVLIPYQVNISVPSSACAGDSVDCSATTIPGDLANNLVWSSGGVPSSGIGASFSTVYTDTYGEDQVITVEDPCSGTVYFCLLDVCGPYNAGDPMPGPFSDSISLTKSLSFGPYNISLIIGGINYGSITIPKIAGVNVSIIGSGSTVGEAHPITYSISGTTSASVGMPISYTYSLSADGTVTRYEHVACDGPNCGPLLQHGSEENTYSGTFHLVYTIPVTMGITYSTPPIPIVPFSGSGPSMHRICGGCI